MRILILSANTGEGHNSSARAIVEALQKKGVDGDIQDCLSFLSPGFSRFISEWHVRLYQHGGKIFDKGYRLMENISNPDNYNPLYELLSLGAGKLHSTIMDGGYSCVVCVHPFAGIMLTEVRRCWNLTIPALLVATDYTCTPTVEQCRMDTFFVPAPEVCEEFFEMDISKENQFVSGIPVSQKFYEPGDKAQARQELGLTDEGTVVLVMGGSMGCGPVGKIVRETLEQMPENAVMVAVCGHNDKLREELEELGDPKLRVLGYTDRIHRYMDAVDMIITKPGGLSSTEAANKHVPMVFINTVGGCESRNFDLFLKKGYAVGSSDPEQTVRIAIRMVWDAAGREKIRSRLEQDFSCNTGMQIAEHIIACAQKYLNDTVV